MRSKIIPIVWLFLVLTTGKASAQSNIQGKIESARILHSQGQLNEAVAVLDLVLKNNSSEKRALLERGTLYYKLGQHQRAINDFTTYLGLVSRSTEGYYKRGLVYLVQQHKRLALADFSQVIEIDSRHSNAYTQRGLVHNLNGNHREALADLDKCLSLNKNSFEGYFYRGVAYYFLGQPGNAIADYNRALKVVPNNKLVYNSRGLAQRVAGQHRQASKDFERATALAKTDYLLGNEAILKKADYYFSDDHIASKIGLFSQNKVSTSGPKLELLDASVDLEQGHVTIALVKMSKLLKASPQDHNLRLARALIYMRTPDYALAKKDLLVVIRQQPDNTEAHRMLGDVYYNLGELDRAVSHYGEYFEHGGSDQAVRLRKAQANYISEEFIEATQDYTEILKNVNIGNAWTYYRARGNAYLAAKNYQKAITDYQTALAGNSNDKLVILKLSEAYYGAGQYDKSLLLLKQGGLSYPSEKAFYQLRTQIWKEQGKLKMAALDLEKAVKINPNYNLYYQLGSVYAEMGDTDRAISHVSKSILLNKSEAFLYRQRGILYQQENKQDKAKADWQVGCQLGDGLACQLLQKN